MRSLQKSGTSTSLMDPLPPYLRFGTTGPSKPAEKCLQYYPITFSEGMWIHREPFLIWLFRVVSCHIMSHFAGYGR